MTILDTAGGLAAVCAALAGRKGLSEAERVALDALPAVKPDLATVEAIRGKITKGGDPLGDAFNAVFSARARRQEGAVYTPAKIVQAMMNWLAAQGTAPRRVVDPGAGSGRFILAAAQAFPRAQLVAVEKDPMAALLLRANLAAHGLQKRATVLVADFREISLPAIQGKTAFIGNPPYVRHHDISEQWKRWYSRTFSTLGIDASELAGLHIHFFLKAFLLASKGDVGAFITSSEWINVNYGAALRNLFIEEMGGINLQVLAPTVEAFPGTATTATIACFKVGETEAPVRIRSVPSIRALRSLETGKEIERTVMWGESRWSTFIQPKKIPISEGFIELGELFRVHRGQVTGANGIWIAGAQAAALPESVKRPTITKARDLILAGAQLTSADALRRVIDIPAELDRFRGDDRHQIDEFLAWAKTQGADQSYIARHRKAWWSVGLKDPAPILCTYMARRAPQFTLNAIGARHINIAHGLYPRELMSPDTLGQVVTWLNANIGVENGRTYAGGLTKFEPKEIERLRIPSLEGLSA